MRCLNNFRAFSYSGSIIKPENIDYGRLNESIFKMIGSADEKDFNDFIKKFYEHLSPGNKTSNHEFSVHSLIKSRINSLNNSSIISLFCCFTTFSKYQADIPKHLLESILDQLIKSSNELKIKDLRLISNIIPKMVSKKIDFSYYFKSLFSLVPDESIKNASINDLLNISEVLSKVGMQNKFFDINIEKESIFSIIEKRLEPEIGVTDIKVLFKFLKCFVINDRGNEDFIRKLENRVFRNVNKLEDKTLSDIAYFYHKRILYPSSYLQENVYKPTYNEFVKRFEEINPLSKTLFLINYWKNSNVNGMYCDEILGDKIKKMLKDREDEKVKNKEKQQHMQTICLSYLAHARQVDSEFIQNYFENIQRNNFNENFFIKSAIYLARYQETPAGFWQAFYKYLPKLKSDPNNFILLYAIHLNLKLKDQANFDLVKNRLDDDFIKVAKKHWDNARRNEIGVGYDSHDHRKMRKYLEMRGVKFESEFYDEYFIDLAIPEMKIAIEIGGPGHYLYPQNILNGKSENRRKTIEKLGWKMNYFHYFYHSEVEGEERMNTFLDRILPLHN